MIELLIIAGCGYACWWVVTRVLDAVFGYGRRHRKP